MEPSGAMKALLGDVSDFEESVGAQQGPQTGTSGSPGWI